MAADLMNFIRVCCNGPALLLLCTASFLASAQVLTDPTKPPAEISAPITQAGQAAAQVSDRLQSIIISPVRRAAIINGQAVELGEKYGDAKLVEVSENGVVLQGAQGRQMLTLFPGVEIKRKDQPEKNKAKYTTKRKYPVKKPASKIEKKEGK